MPIQKKKVEDYLKRKDQVQKWHRLSSYLSSLSTQTSNHQNTSSATIIFLHSLTTLLFHIFLFGNSVMSYTSIWQLSYVVYFYLATFLCRILLFGNSVMLYTFIWQLSYVLYFYLATVLSRIILSDYSAVIQLYLTALLCRILFFQHCSVVQFYLATLVWGSIC